MTAARRRAPADRSEQAGGTGFWVAVVVGAAIAGYGLVGLFEATPATRPPEALLAAFGLDVLHDTVLAPVACAVGILLSRWLSPAVRRPVRAGLFATFVVLLVGWAPLRGYGRARVPDNPTVDPLDYATAIPTVVAVVWLLVALWLAVAWWRRRDASGRAVS